jgi:hypothetical protein
MSFAVFLSLMEHLLVLCSSHIPTIEQGERERNKALPVV